MTWCPNPRHAWGGVQTQKGAHVRSSQEQPISTYIRRVCWLTESPTWQVYNIRIGHTSVYNFLQCLAEMPEASHITADRMTHKERETGLNPRSNCFMQRVSLLLEPCSRCLRPPDTSW